MENPRKMLTDILAAIDHGQTVYVCTYTRATKLDAACVARFAAIGRPLLKATDRSLYMASGRSYVCIDYCAFRFSGGENRSTLEAQERAWARGEQ